MAAPPKCLQTFLALHVVNQQDATNTIKPPPGCKRLLNDRICESARGLAAGTLNSVSAETFVCALYQLFHETQTNLELSKTTVELTSKLSATEAADSKHVWHALTDDPEACIQNLSVHLGSLYVVAYVLAKAGTTSSSSSMQTSKKKASRDGVMVTSPVPVHDEYL